MSQEQELSELCRQLDAEPDSYGLWHRYLTLKRRALGDDFLPLYKLNNPEFPCLLTPELVLIKPIHERENLVFFAASIADGAFKKVRVFDSHKQFVHLEELQEFVADLRSKALSFMSVPDSLGLSHLFFSKEGLNTGQSFFEKWRPHGQRLAIDERIRADRGFLKDMATVARLLAEAFAAGFSIPVLTPDSVYFNEQDISIEGWADPLLERKLSEYMLNVTLPICQYRYDYYRMPPEMIRGEPLEERTLVYTLGAMIYEYFAGVFPYKMGSTIIQTFVTILEDSPKSLREVRATYSKELSDLVQRCLSCQLDQRPATLIQFAAICESIKVYS